MSPFANPEFADHPRHAYCAGRFGPPLPLKLLGVGAAFLLCKPFGFVALGLLAYSHFRRRHVEGHGPWQGFQHRRRAFFASGNTAFDERQRETLNQLAEDAKAFEDFRRKQREARDKAALDEFMKARTAEPKSPEANNGEPTA